jgi:putative FmdB family regulatory protein
MPTYEYACRSCGQHLEVVQSFKDDPLTECPQCQGELRKVFSPIGIAFKGSGFYRNDSRPSDGKSSDKKSDSKSTGTESKSESKSETKSSDSSSSSSTSTKSETKAASA